MNAAIGSIAVIAASILFYLASPNRKIALRLDYPKGLKITGSLGLLVGIAFFLTWSGPATSVFIAFTLIMAILTLAPLGIAWWIGTPEHKK